MKLRELYEAEGKTFKDEYGESPEKITSNFDCDFRGLTSLEGAPQSVGGYFGCENNQLTSLEGIPKSIGNNLYCGNNKLTSLKNIHKQIKSMNGFFNAIKNPIKSHVIGLILISGCRRVALDNKKVEEILNKYLGKGRAGLLDCAEELIKAGFPEMARL